MILCEFLKNIKNEIIEKWVKLLKTEVSSKYQKRPEKELYNTVSLAFQGNLEVICNNNWKTIEDFIIFITKLRLERGFTLSEVQRAFGLFRIIMLDILPDHFSKTELRDALKKVNLCVDVTINRFSEYFQKKHDEVKENILRTLEFKVKERTKELENSEKRYKTLVEDINDGYFVSSKGEIIYANNALCKMFNYSKNEILNKKISKLVKNYNEILKNFKNSENIETIGLKKEGYEFPIEIKANRIEFESKPAIAGICRDITERIKSIENERLAVIGRLSSAFAHEIRNSISSIKVNIQILKNKLPLDEIDKKRMELIFKDIEKLDKIIKDSLFFAKPIELNISRNNINTIINDAVEFILPILKQNNINLELKLYKNLKDIQIDQERFEFVLENLFYNSIDALSGKKNKKIKIETKQKTNSQQIIFYDNGCGIEENNLKNIFKPFFTTKSKGMGLGLANVERIVKLHNGKIDIKSKPDKYTKVLIELPC